VPTKSRSSARRLEPWYNMAPLPIRINCGRREGGTSEDAATEASRSAARRVAEMQVREDIVSIDIMAGIPISSGVNVFVDD
jgi:hypothetical protein